MSDELKDTLEALVDRIGLAAVLIGLREVCSDKSENLELHWQDGVRAKEWIKGYKACDVAAFAAEEFGL